MLKCNIIGLPVSFTYLSNTPGNLIHTAANFQIENPCYVNSCHMVIAQYTSGRQMQTLGPRRTQKTNSE